MGSQSILSQSKGAQAIGSKAIRIHPRSGTNVGSSIAMAMLKGGRALMGVTVYLPMLDGSVIEAEVVEPIFYDPKGERLNG